jgi:DNA relaxase NicK
MIEKRKKKVKFIDNLLVGTLGIGSRRSSLFIRIYTKHKLFVRYEAELKQDKARDLFKQLANLRSPKHSDVQIINATEKVLAHAALDWIDFRDKSSISSPKNATKARTNRLPFWQDLRDTIFLIYPLKSYSKLLLSK